MKSLKSKFGIVFLSILLITLLTSCQDPGIPDKDTIKATYDVNISKILLNVKQNTNYCFSDGVDYDKNTKEFYGTGYVVYLDGYENPYDFYGLYIYENDVLVSAKYGLHPWDVTSSKINLNIDETEGTASFDSKSIKVHERDEYGDHSPNYMVNLSCTNAIVAE